MRRIRYFVALSRPRTCFLSVFAFLLGYKSSGEVWTLGASLALLASFLVSSLANLHNATTDGEEDSIFLTGRQKAINHIGSSVMKKMLFILASFIAVLLCASSLVNLILAPVGLFLLLAYSQRPWRVKTRPLLGAFVFSLVTVFPYLGGSMMSAKWSVIRLDDFDYLKLLMLWILMVAKFFIKNLPDYEPDKESGLLTSATVFSSYKTAASVSVSLEILAYLLVVLYSVSTLHGLELFIVIVTALVGLVHPVRFMSPYDISKLNNAMKWDMFCSTFFLAIWSFSMEWNERTIIWGICVVLWLFTMVIPVDSREGDYINEGKRYVF